MIWYIFLTLYMTAVIIYDATRFIIPNLLVAAFLLLYPVHVFTSPAAILWLPALGLALGTFILGYIFFLLRWMGGGDVKLFAVCILWAGFTDGALQFFIWMGLLGGVLAIMLMPIRYIMPPLLHHLKKEQTLPRLFKTGEPLPYGVAIAGAFLIVLWTGNVPGLPLP